MTPDQLAQKPEISQHGPPVRAGFLAPGNPNSLRTWSGLPYFMFDALAHHFGSLTPLTPVSDPWIRAANLWSSLTTRVTGIRRPPYLNPLLVQASRARLRALLAADEPDVVIATAASTLLTAVPRHIPVIYCTDATFRIMQGYYEKFTGLPDDIVRRAERFEQEAITRADAIVYSSEWAAVSAVRDYGADPAKITILPFGASLVNPPAAPVPVPSLDGALRFFLLGVDWHRKGADGAFEAVSELNRRGQPAHLTIAGCVPPPGVALPDWVENIPHLSKANPADVARMEQLYRTAHFFLMPSRAECSAVVFGEAAAFGLPVIAMNTGGLAAVVTDGETGALLPAGSSPADYADRISAILADPAGYSTMRAASRARYENVLNWDAWAKQIASIAGGLTANAL